MSYFTPFILVRWGLSLIAGIVFARLLRKPVRVIVTRLIPIQKRIADDFFKRLTRITTIVGAVIALSVAALSNWGLVRLAGAWQRTEQTTITPHPDNWEETAPEPPKPVVPQPVEELSLLPESYETPAPPAKVTPQPVAPSPEAPPQGAFYLQLYAFENRDNAQRQLNACPVRPPYRCYLAYASGEAVPYKILAGPFPSPEAARQYRGRARLNGFPRSGAELEINNF